MKLKTERAVPDGRWWADIQALAREAFPPEEYLAPEKIAEMAEGEAFDFLVLMDEETFVGFMVVQTYEDLAYLFFLAIEPRYRSKGYGSRAIETLKALYPDRRKIVDLEMQDAKAENREQRQRRKEFYRRNGYRESGMFLSYMGVDYEVMCMEDNFPAERFKAMMATIPVEGFEPVYFTKEVKNRQNDEGTKNYS